MAKQVLAVDLGASSGRVILGRFDGERISLEEIHRFPNEPVDLGGTMYWDFLRLFHEIKQGLIKSKQYGKVDSLGVDTWGVDFGLIDKNGRLLENPVHYRDSRTKGMLDAALELIPKESFYAVTGNQFMEINTAFQLMSVQKNRPELLAQADKMLLMPNLFTFFLTGEKVTEQSIASTTQLYDQTGSCWAYRLAEKLSISESLFTNIVPAGTKIGTLTQKIVNELDIPEMDVYAVCGHDTQSAMAAVPALSGDFAFLSCGTWSLLGTELDEPLTDEKACANDLTNEVGCGGKVSFLKNIIGLWLIQESRRQWQREGRDFSFSYMEALANSAEPFRCFIDPDDPRFVPSGDIPERVRKFCMDTAQPIPATEGQVLRCIYESLALKYRLAVEELEACTGKSFPVIHMIGGGIRDRLLCQMTANACKRQVAAGPVEATALGNIAVQLIASGDIRDLSEARRSIAGSEKLTVYQPESPMQWDKAYEDFKHIIRR
ncbi:rhamnulokinase family protein [Ruminococcus sp.]|uniref:rhamnulokinase n=1 Tax=Ruminococcus sp. TaxID=41978 RepID=UPI0025D74BC4|nr:rhamnulokinase family protein [Ruminococcus sp.]MBQ8966411.1 rhamnulokinase [Ruminococcus sp.]